MDTSPRLGMATSFPAARKRHTASAASWWAACCTALSRDMANRRDRISFPETSMAPRTMSNASISPLLVWGQASTGQAVSTFMAFTVSSSGSPGPTPTP